MGYLTDEDREALRAAGGRAYGVLDPWADEEEQDPDRAALAELEEGAAVTLPVRPAPMPERSLGGETVTLPAEIFGAAPAARPPMEFTVAETEQAERDFGPGATSPGNPGGFGYADPRPPSAAARTRVAALPEDADQAAEAGLRPDLGLRPGQAAETMAQARQARPMEPAGGMQMRGGEIPPEIVAANPPQSAAAALRAGSGSPISPAEEQTARGRIPLAGPQGRPHIPAGYEGLPGAGPALATKEPGGGLSAPDHAAASAEAEADRRKRRILGAIGEILGARPGLSARMGAQGGDAIRRYAMARQAYLDNLAQGRQARGDKRQIGLDRERQQDRAGLQRQRLAQQATQSARADRREDLDRERLQLMRLREERATAGLEGTQADRAARLELAQAREARMGEGQEARLELRRQAAERLARRRGRGGGGGGGRSEARQAARAQLIGDYANEIQELDPGLSSDQALSRAEAQIGGLSNRALERVAVNRLTTGARHTQRETRRDRELLQSRTTQYHTRLERTGFPLAEVSLARAERATRGLSTAQLRAASRVIGRPEEINVLANADPRAATAARAMTLLMSAELKDISGAAVTDSEFNRYIAGRGGRSLLDADGLPGALRSMREDLDARRQDFDRGYRDVIEAEQGEAQRAPDTVRVRDPQSGTIRRIPRSRLPAALERGLERVR